MYMYSKTLLYNLDRLLVLQYTGFDRLFWERKPTVYRRLLRIRPPNNPPMGDLSEEKSTWALIWSKSLTSHADSVMVIQG